MSTHIPTPIARVALTSAALVALTAVLAASSLGATHAGVVHVSAQLMVTGRTQNCHAGVCIVKVQGHGHMRPYGAITFSSRITADSNKPPCPGGSWVRITRTLHTGKGAVVLTGAGLQCVQAGGPRVDLVWVLDGGRSSGSFAGAHGRGSDLAFPARNTTTIRGAITLAG